MHPIRALYVGFVNRLSMCVFFQTASPEYVFSVRNRRVCWFTLYSSFYLPIMYCMETFVITYDYLSHHCRKDYLKYKGSFEQNALLFKGHYPFSVDLRPGIDWLCSDGCCMKILRDIGIFGQSCLIWESIWSLKVEVQFKLDFQLQVLHWIKLNYSTFFLKKLSNKLN